MMAGVNANNRAENNPAVVPPIFLTRPNITIVVREPRIAGSKIVKSSKDIPPPKI
jgi:hypothetical protein